MSKDTNQKKKKPSLLKRLFGGKSDMSIYEEELVQSPFRTIISNFKDNKVAMTGLIGFSIILLIVLIGPFIFPITTSFSEVSQINVAPGLDMMDVPEELQGNIKQISIGPTFSVGISNNGDVYIWGKTKISSALDVANIPEDMGKIVQVSAGFDHIIFLNEDGKLFFSGNNRQRQSTPTYEVENLTNIKQIEAGYQSSVVVTEDGYVYYFGNSMNNDYNEMNPYQGQIDKVATTSDGVIGLTKSGEVVYLGNQQNAYTRIPENMGKIVDIGTTASTVAAVNENGKVFVWGNISTNGEGNPPELDEKIISIQGGRYHYTALTESGRIVSWGANNYKQTEVPSELKDVKVVSYFIDSYQNYAIDENNNLHTWGLKGYLLGTDELGRDIFSRLINGGRMSVFIGAVAVIISTIIGIVVGSVSGFVGGKVDMVLQRISEMVSSLPFLPFAMILSSLIGNKIPPNQRVFLIMVILGLLSWPGLQRLVRAQILSIREQEYVTAAKSVGIKQVSIIFKHILPNVVSVIIVSATLDFATSMLTEATLSYLGFGVQAPQPTWGNMLYGANNSIVIQNYWWRWVFASIILGVCVICINLIGDGLRDAIDPKSQER
ncbi:MAG TPA: ABC transporter permease subunit [Soehngenia sp.]|nr:ABC transporter permease subunit [Soehngenia sp.]HPP31673.1 ABC transporter permease subunit [Soehngenia sp.]